ncbi:MAG: hypothetical protein WB930_16035 [Syntrophobacteraceae bacterium]
MNELPKSEGLVDIDEMAGVLKVPRSWIYGQTRRKGPNTIPTIRAGKYLRFVPGEVVAWLRKQEEKRI